MWEHILLPLLGTLSCCEHPMLHGATRSQERKQPSLRNRKCKQGSIYQQQLSPNTQAVLFLRGRCPGGPALPQFCCAQSLLPCSWFSHVERDRQIQMHTPQQISTNGTPQRVSGKSGWPAENGIAQMPLRTPPSSAPQCCKKLLSLLPTNVFPAGPAMHWPQALGRDILLPDQQHLQGAHAGGLCSVFRGRNVKVMNLSKLQFDGQG